MMMMMSSPTRASEWNIIDDNIHQLTRELITDRKGFTQMFVDSARCSGPRSVSDCDDINFIPAAPETTYVSDFFV